uniref:Uncharacterized protein n=1 Tax=Bursaphelenchus xylophilus TaxID=6326 RepID=A0A1I7SC10_BURXY
MDGYRISRCHSDGARRQSGTYLRLRASGLSLRSERSARIGVKTPTGPQEGEQDEAGGPRNLLATGPGDGFSRPLSRSRTSSLSPESGASLARPPAVDVNREKERESKSAHSKQRGRAVCLHLLLAPHTLSLTEKRKKSKCPRLTLGSCHQEARPKSITPASRVYFLLDALRGKVEGSGRDWTSATHSQLILKIFFIRLQR